jgi:hypothetical protein
MRALIRLFPRTWRARYEEEFAALLADLPASPSLVLDVLRAAARANADAISNPQGGPGMGFVSAPSRRAGGLGLLGLAISLPTLVFVVANLLQYGLGIQGPADLIDPLYPGPPIGWLILILPLVGFALAAVPVVGVTIARGEGGLRSEIVIHMRPFNVFAGLVTGGLAAFIVAHLIAG